MRLFVAVFPSSDAASDLDGAVRSADLPGDAIRKLRWTQPEQRHITLAFYGDVAPGAAEAVAVGLAQRFSGIGPFRIRVCGAGRFDTRVLWAGVGGVGDTGSLADLAAAANSVGAARRRIRPEASALVQATPDTGTCKEPSEGRSCRQGCGGGPG